MAEAIDAINRYASRGRDAFEKDELLQSFFIRHLLMIGDAAAKIPREFQSEHPDIPWGSMIGMRNVLVHQYFGIDLDVVWNAVSTDIPALEKQVRALARKLS